MNDLNWLATMKKERRSIEKNETRELVEKPIKKPIDMKWVYKLKQRPNSEISKHKARQVASGFLQNPGIDFEKLYAPMESLETIRIVVSIGWKIH